MEQYMEYMDVNDVHVGDGREHVTETPDAEEVAQRLMSGKRQTPSDEPISQSAGR